ncbi:MAG: AsmA family protein [Planctomycetota bacterium]|jgi:hypothetical protein
MRKRRRRIVRGVFVLLLVLVVLFPYVAVVQPFRDAILRAALPKIEGTVTSGSASLGWFSPIEFRDVEIRSPDAAPVVVVPRFRGDRTMWRYLIDGRELGEFRMERPRLNVAVSENGSNLRGLIAADAPRPPDLSVGLEIVDGSLSFRSRHAPKPWSVDGFNLKLALRPGSATESGHPELILRKGVVLDRAPITPAMCDDLLKYIAPVLAEATDLSGEFSIELDDWRLPLADLAKGEGSGRLTIHAIDAGPGPLIRALTVLLELPGSVRLADGSIVRFKMAEGRVRHDDLRFGVGEMQIRTQGSVGFDQTLDLVAEIPIPARLLGDLPLPEALKTSTLKLPIRGTLSEPKIEAADLGTSNVDLLLKTLGDVLRERTGQDGGLLDQIPKSSGETPLLDLIREGPLLDRLRQRRQQKR